MKRIFNFLSMGCLSLICITLGCTQSTTGSQVPESIQVRNPEFNKKLAGLLTFDVPLISVDSLYTDREDYFLLDIRTPDEYQVSHIRDAHFINFDNPDLDIVEDLSRETPIVVYCSVGYRSEKTGRKLLEMGFTSVYNLYGSIFEWVNAGYPVVDSAGEVSHEIHTYNKRWSQYVYNPDMIKTW